MSVRNPPWPRAIIVARWSRLKNALQKDPNLHGRARLLAEVALWLGDASNAEAELNKVPKAGGPDPHSSFGSASIWRWGDLRRRWKS